MLNRISLIAFALLFTLSTTSALPAGEVVINYEFSDSQHLFVDLNVLSSGGSYWNRVGSSFFSTPQEFLGPKDEFGNVIPPADPFIWPPDRQVPTLRPRLAWQAAVTSSPSAVEVPGIGSLIFEGQNIVEIIGMMQHARYDVAVYYRPLSSPAGSIKLSDVAGSPIADPSFVTPTTGLERRVALFTDVSPIEMHIGPIGAYPLGFGVGYYAPGSPTPPQVEIYGIQIRGVVPEPSSIALAGLSVLMVAAVRRRR